MSKFNIGDIVYFYADKDRIDAFGVISKGEVVEILQDFDEKIYLVKTLEEEYRFLLVRSAELTHDSSSYDNAVEIKKITDQMKILSERLKKLR